MPSAIGSNGSNGFAPQQTQIALSTSFSDIQLLSNFDALELQGHVFIDAASDYRASFKLSIIKNGAGVYEIAASDIAGDDYIGSPIMSFQILGNYLQCKSDVPLTGSDSAYVKFNIDTPTPALVGSSSLSIEGSNIVSEIPSARLPLATGSSAGAIPYYEEGTWSPSFTSLTNLQAVGTSTITFGAAKYTRVGRLVTATIEGISNLEIIAVDTLTQSTIASTGLPGLTDSTYIFGNANVRALTMPREILPALVADNSAANTDIYFQILSDSSLIVVGEDLQVFGITIQYYID